LSGTPPEPVRLACAAMGTRFELVVEDGSDADSLRAAGEAAIDEVLLWHGRLTAFESSSVVSHIARSGGEWCSIDAETADLLELCRGMWERTAGAFDPTVGPLMEAWGLRGGGVDLAAVAAARACTGMSLVELDGRRVRLTNPRVRLDLGGVGKGWAIDRALEILRGAGVSRALIHAGTSSIGAIGRWQVAVRFAEGDERPLALADTCLSVSAPRGRAAAGVAHILDPRLGCPVPGRVTTAAVVHGSAAAADAMSTALIVDPSLRGMLTASLNATIFIEPDDADTRAIPA
jgi:thiamine biosynthesis lipoprotein